MPLKNSAIIYQIININQTSRLVQFDLFLKLNCGDQNKNLKYLVQQHERDILNSFMTSIAIGVKIRNLIDF